MQNCLCSELRSWLQRGILSSNCYGRAAATIRYSLFILFSKRISDMPRDCELREVLAFPPVVLPLTEGLCISFLRASVAHRVGLLLRHQLSLCYARAKSPLNRARANFFTDLRSSGCRCWLGDRLLDRRALARLRLGLALPC